MDDKQREFLRRRFDEVAAKQPRYVHLRERLLQIGGEELVPRNESDLETLLSTGSVMEGAITLAPMAESSCHENVSRLWLETPRTITGIATGYGLSDDGLWRQHSWAILSNGLVETTEPRERYFGVLFTGKIADSFARKNSRHRRIGQRLADVITKLLGG